MLRKLLAAPLVIVSVAAASLAATAPAEAHYRRQSPFFDCTGFFGGNLLPVGYGYGRPHGRGNYDGGYGPYDSGFLRPCHMERRFLEDGRRGYWVRVKICD